MKTISALAFYWSAINEKPFKMTTTTQPEILLVEDNDDDAEIVLSVLKKNNIGHALHRVNNGKDAINYLLKNGKHTGEDKNNIPRVILLDINLPGTNGIEILREIRENPFTQYLPVIVFTSSTDVHHIFNTSKLGINAYVRKQTNIENFEKELLQIRIYLEEIKSFCLKIIPMIRN